MWTGSQVPLTRTEVADEAGLEALYLRMLSVRPPAMLNLRVSEVAVAEHPLITPATAPLPLLYAAWRAPRAKRWPTGFLSRG